MKMTADANNSFLQKCGDLYIKFDEQNNALYGFACDDNLIRKFYLLNKQLPEEIILPNLDVDKKLRHAPIMQTLAKQRHSAALKKYLTGAVKIASNCFAGIDNTKIVVPAACDYSIALPENFFNKHENVELVTPDLMQLKLVKSQRDNGDYDYDNKRWLLLAHRDFNYSQQQIGTGTESITVSDFVLQAQDIQKLTTQIDVNKDALTPWERANMKLDAIRKAGFKKELVHDYRQFAAGIKHELDVMNEKVKPSDLHKTMDL